MIETGKYNTLKIDRSTTVGLFLTDGTNDVLLPNKYVPKDWEQGQELTVFVYLDQEERKVATTLKPYIELDSFSLLRVSYINKFGAFMDWGLEKDLFVPFREQARPMEEGKRYLIYMSLDEKSNRLVGSSKISQFLDNEELTVTEGEEVDLIVSRFTDMGVNVIINEKHEGLIYKNEVYDDLRLGERLTGFIKTIRPGNKVDVSLVKAGVEAIEPNAEKILDELRASRGFLRLTDDSHPEDIKTVLKMSKKAFKKAVGSLYKQRLIEIKEDGIYLVK
ncbi:GntR family transcriptional regulator [Flavobacterium akiainvivens]|uniref:GntR family transcriptional regulator n=1 Tax=Flavobacterium akiainvivens TaxID=1202724 RepID=A0A0M9VH94_9FLAO|nr:S1-like domain-containing RNA-binding protein [Flavobacterium akiainvivens]KOS05329.1 GntR family transcriptional regulator [Flavobacterium akiainvivens]